MHFVRPKIFSIQRKTLLILFVYKAGKSRGTWGRLGGWGGSEGMVKVMCLFLSSATDALDKNRSHFVNSGCVGVYIWIYMAGVIELACRRCVTVWSPVL